MTNQAPDSGNTLLCSDPIGAAPSIDAPSAGQLIWPDVILPFIFTRLALLCIGWLAIWLLPAARAPQWNGPVPSLAIDMWSHFDGQWYLSVSRDGYHFSPSTQSNIAFSPLLPMIMTVGGSLLGGSDSARLAAGIILSNLSLIAALAYLAALLRLEGFDRPTAARAVLYILIFPTTLFLSAVYPMSLFLALSTAAFYYARRRRWPIVGALTALAALARPDGVLLAAALAVEYLHQNSFSLRKLRPDCLWLTLPPLALLGWMALQWRLFGNPLAFVATQAAWSAAPWRTALHSSHAALQLGYPALFILLTALTLHYLRPSYAAFAISFLSLMLMAARFWSITRFLLILFPAFAVLALLGRRWRILHLAYVATSMPLATFLMMRFALNQWVA